MAIFVPSTTIQLYGKPITTNDRTFACDNNGSIDVDSIFKCDTGNNVGQVFNSRTVDQIFADSSINILDTTVIRNNLTAVSQSIYTVYTDMIARIEALEGDVERRIIAGEIPKDNNLFVKVTRIQPKLRAAKNDMLTWKSNTLNDLRELGNILRQYDQIVSKIKMAMFNTTSGASSALNDFYASSYIAKQNLSKSKSISAAIRRLINLDTRLRYDIHSVQLNLNELSSGILRSSNSQHITDMNEIIDLLNTLHGDRSPLARIELDMSNLVNNTPIRFRLDTANMQLIEPPTQIPILVNEPTVFSQNPIIPIRIPSQQQQQQQDTAMETNDPDFRITPAISTEEAMAFVEKYLDTHEIAESGDVAMLNKLMDFEQTTINTQIVLNALEKFTMYTNQNFTNSPLYEQIIAKIEDIKRNNDPEQVIMRLRQEAANPANVYAVRYRVNALQLFVNREINGKPGNEITELKQYSERLSSILNQVRQIFVEELNSDHGYETISRSIYTTYNLTYEPSMTLSSFALTKLDSAYQAKIEQQTAYQKAEYAKYRAIFEDRVRQLSPNMSPEARTRAMKDIVNGLAQVKNDIEIKMLRMRTQHNNELRVMMESMLNQQQQQQQQALQQQQLQPQGPLNIDNLVEQSRQLDDIDDYQDANME